MLIEKDKEEHKNGSHVWGDLINKHVETNSIYPAIIDKKTEADKYHDYVSLMIWHWGLSRDNCL